MPTCSNMLRLCGPVFLDSPDPLRWTKALRSYGYSPAFCPVTSDANMSTIRAYTQAAVEAEALIAEVGA